MDGGDWLEKATWTTFNDPCFFDVFCMSEQLLSVFKGFAPRAKLKTQKTSKNH